MSLGQCNPQSKILWHLDRVREWQNTGTTRPLIFEIDPSNKCNQDCPWCSFAKLRSESQAMMCENTITTLLKSLKSLGVKAINWTGGGEPLLNPATIPSIKYAHFLGLDQGMFTNGVLITGDKAKALARLMTWVRFSIDASNPKDYAQSHGTSDKMFQVVLDNLKNICSIPGRCTIGVGYIMTPQNYEDAHTLAQIVRDAGADYIQFKPVVHRKPTRQLDPSIVQKMNNIAHEIRKAYETPKFKVMVTDYRFKDIMDVEGNHGRAYTKCLSHHFQGAIGADSKVYLCDHHKGEPDYEFGDLTKNTLEEIWTSDKRKETIARLDATDLSQCIDCCRNHELNKFLWHVNNVDKELHPNHI